MDTVVERELDIDLMLSPERSIPVPARLTYCADDPYAVRITFHITSLAPVTWTFARDLLVDGVFRPAGEGDVRVWPARAGGRTVVCLGLTSPEGEAVVLAQANVVTGWLERTMRVVPPGAEAELLGLDEGLRVLLAAESG
ncbi:SsgA family sporulation/cell division regulator [Streptomyces sp. NPDC001262]|uniref:SsgA family sporulation/cell division regulator n=1 Tax=Streptomyces TaxID=1883 RepID=UPI00369F4CB8